MEVYNFLKNFINCEDENIRNFENKIKNFVTDKSIILKINELLRDIKNLEIEKQIRLIKILNYYLENQILLKKGDEINIFSDNEKVEILNTIYSTLFLLGFENNLENKIKLNLYYIFETNFLNIGLSSRLKNQLMTNFINNYLKYFEDIIKSDDNFNDNNFYNLILYFYGISIYNSKISYKLLDFEKVVLIIEWFIQKYLMNKLNNNFNLLNNENIIFFKNLNIFLSNIKKLINKIILEDNEDVDKFLFLIYNKNIIKLITILFEIRANNENVFFDLEQNNEIIILGNSLKLESLKILIKIINKLYKMITCYDGNRLYLSNFEEIIVVIKSYFKYFNNFWIKSKTLNYNQTKENIKGNNNNNFLINIFILYKNLMMFNEFHSHFSDNFNDIFNEIILPNIMINEEEKNDFELDIEEYFKLYSNLWGKMNIIDKKIKTGEFLYLLCEKVDGILKKVFDLIVKNFNENLNKDCNHNMMDNLDTCLLILSILQPLLLKFDDYKKIILEIIISISQKNFYFNSNIWLSKYLFFINKYTIFIFESFSEGKISVNYFKIFFKTMNSESFCYQINYISVAIIKKIMINYNSLPKNSLSYFYDEIFKNLKFFFDEIVNNDKDINYLLNLIKNIIYVILRNLNYFKNYDFSIFNTLLNIFENRLKYNFQAILNNNNNSDLKQKCILTNNNIIGIIKLFIYNKNILFSFSSRLFTIYDLLIKNSSKYELNLEEDLNSILVNIFDKNKNIEDDKYKYLEFFINNCMKERNLNNYIVIISYFIYYKKEFFENKIIINPIMELIIEYLGVDSLDSNIEDHIRLYKNEIMILLNIIILDLPFNYIESYLDIIIKMIVNYIKIFLNLNLNNDNEMKEILNDDYLLRRYISIINSLLFKDNKYFEIFEIEFIEGITRINMLYSSLFSNRFDFKILNCYMISYFNRFFIERFNDSTFLKYFNIFLYLLKYNYLLIYVNHNINLEKDRKFNLNYGNFILNNISNFDKIEKWLEENTYSFKRNNRADFEEMNNLGEDIEKLEVFNHLLNNLNKYNFNEDIKSKIFDINENDNFRTLLLNIKNQNLLIFDDNYNSNDIKNYINDIFYTDSFITKNFNEKRKFLKIIK